MKCLFLILLFSFPILASAQKQGDVWLFGIKAGLDFSSGSPTVITTAKTGTDVPLGGNQEGTACISDSSGKLLFYTGGQTIWNRYDNTMPNGNSIMGGVSSSQSSIIVPKPGSNTIFYVFTSDEFQNYFAPNIQKGYRYSIVDMCLDSGRGDVPVNQKNILLSDSSTEKLAVCEDFFGTGYWIMGHKMFSDKFLAWHLTSAGLSAPVISSTGTLHGWLPSHSVWNNGSAQGQLKFNPQANKIALAIGNYDPATIDLFDFNNATGAVTNFCHIAIDSALSKRSYGVEFSPDGTKLYAGVTGGAGGPRLYQYDISTGDCGSIIASQVKIFQSHLDRQIIGMQLAPDNKIYLLCNLPGDLGSINFPNNIGTASVFDSSVVSIAPGKNAYTLPSFIAGYKYHNALACQAVNPLPGNTSCIADIKIYPNPVSNFLMIDKIPNSCKINLNVYNSIGQLIIQGKKIEDGYNKILLSKLSPGLYYYYLITDENTLLYGKFIKM